MLFQTANSSAPMMLSHVPQNRDGFAESPVGHWVACLWNFDAGNGFPHPQDAESINQLCPHGLTTPCVAVEGEYFVLRHQGHDIRVRPFSIRIMPFPPRYVPGDCVRTSPGPDAKTSPQSTVRAVSWHMKRRQYTYYLNGGGHVRRRMYFEDQLEKTT